ncbi:hypothetical protein [Hyalangium versicolor]|uniref:hypothetical protein n=1 Tax=Hyalangium versicolor TaxID=2861190 RepID=UPI001CCED637|nr:hypothetical protein [Hyalangium versicolor]
MRVLFVLSLAFLALPGAASAATPEVRATPARVVLGQDTAVEVEVHLPEGSGPVHAVASSGSFAQAEVEGGALRKFQWTPPDVRYPLMAVLVFWVSGPQGTPESAVLRIPLLGRTTLPVTTDPGAEVVMDIAGARFGPVKADRRGRAQVPVEVPPGMKEAHVLATRGSLQTDRVVKLDVPSHRPLAALLTPDPLPHSGGWLVVAGEESLSAEQLQLTAEGASLEPLPGGPLLYRVKPTAKAQTVSVEARRREGRDTVQVQAAVQAEAPPAQIVAVAPPPPSPVAEPHKLAVHLLAGGFFAGGANRGPTVALGASYPLPFWQERIAAELEVGFRRASLSATIEGYGTLRSRVLAGPLLASARVTLLQRSALSLYGRAGAGVLPFQHDVSSDFQQAFDESKLGAMAFLSAQGAYRLGRVSLLLEFRGEYGPAQTSRLSAQLGGAGASLGVRYVP